MKFVHKSLQANSDENVETKNCTFLTFQPLNRSGLSIPRICQYNYIRRITCSDGSSLISYTGKVNKQTTHNGNGC